MQVPLRNATGKAASSSQETGHRLHRSCRQFFHQFLVTSMLFVAAQGLAFRRILKSTLYCTHLSECIGGRASADLEYTSRMAHMSHQTH